MIAAIAPIVAVIRPSPHNIGPITLDPEGHLLSGPRGSIRLRPMQYAVLERLIRRPGSIVTRAMFMDAMYPDPDDEPDAAIDVLRTTLSQLRMAMSLLGSRDVVITADLGDGYVLRVQARRA